ncbi:unnamed protein product [Soboliphyme baturini]|uniref:Reverse transcriptase n=1 Tax=Soboliphyme baturini TaxID=241478 RepID=A0A183IH50_9BILA|nr:unnamed protein product [Soboliphyme baturini]
MSLFRTMSRRHWELTVGNWNISSFRWKGKELVDDSIKYQHCWTFVNEAPRPWILNHHEWKLFYSGVDITTRAQAGVLIEPNIADRISHWKPVSERVVILQLKLQQAKALTAQVYAPNLEGKYYIFLEEVQCALSKVPNAESLIPMNDINAHIRANTETRERVT